MGPRPVVVHRCATTGRGLMRHLASASAQFVHYRAFLLMASSGSTVQTWHPLVGGHVPPWTSGWGEEVDFGPFVEIKVGKVKQRLRWIPEGRFLMGSPDDEPGRNADREGPQHVVTISEGFWLFDTSVTQELYEAVTGENPSEFKDEKHDKRRPVENVSWHDCQKVIERLNDRIPELNAGRPTEAEWEHACRAGTTEATFATLKAETLWSPCLAFPADSLSKLFRLSAR